VAASGHVAETQWVVQLMVDQLSIDTWRAVGKWGGATWPRHGLPRGTSSLGTMFSKMFEAHGVQPCDLVVGKILW
jgi:hypothetical protein